MALLTTPLYCGAPGGVNSTPILLSSQKRRKSTYESTRYCRRRGSTRCGLQPVTPPVREQPFRDHQRVGLPPQALDLVPPRSTVDRDEQAKVAAHGGNQRPHTDQGGHVLVAAWPRAPLAPVVQSRSLPVTHPQSAQGSTSPVRVVPLCRAISPRSCSQAWAREGKG